MCIIMKVVPICAWGITGAPLDLNNIAPPLTDLIEILNAKPFNAS